MTGVREAWEQTRRACLAEMSAEILRAWGDSRSQVDRVTAGGAQAVLELCEVAEAALRVGDAGQGEGGDVLGVLREVGRGGERAGGRRGVFLVGLRGGETKPAPYCHGCVVEVVP